jgi:hypothetical protein
MKRNDTKAPSRAPTQDRAARLEAQLKANLKKRKDQARARSQGNPPVTPGEKS